MPRQLQPCGTPAAFSRHYRRGEPVDEACEEAHRTQAREHARSKAKGKPNRPIARATACTNCGGRRRPREGAHGWCNACYLRWLYADRPDDGPPPKYDPTRRRNSRQEEYVFLRETGDSANRAAERLNADRRTAAKWEQHYLQTVNV